MLLISFGFGVNAQLKEVKKLQLIQENYDSILVDYQKRAKDSLSALKKSERNVIMERIESKILEKRKKEEYTQLDKIKNEELDLLNLKTPEKRIKCQSFQQFIMPNLLGKKTKYKPTISETTKRLEKEQPRQVSSIMTFVVNEEGFVKNVNAEGTDEDFNKELEITLYKVEKLLPACINGFFKSQKFRMPVTLNFK